MMPQMASTPAQHRAEVDIFFLAGAFSVGRFFVELGGFG
jgi:hypothetical protein